jgi:uncharacterized membrane protein YfcA
MTLGAAILIGGLIGSVGIGGVLLVPFLTTVIGMNVRESIAIAMASYIATGLVAIVQSRATGDWGQIRRYEALILATLPGAFLGGLAIAVIPDRIALFILAVFLVATGASSLLRRWLPARKSSGAEPGWPLGLFAGFASALSGTGGPAVLMPILIWRGVPLLLAILLGQVVQLPIALAATAGNVASGPFNLWIAVLVAVGMAPGVVGGRWGATRLPVVLLGRIVEILLVATGLLMAVRALS